MVKNIIVLAAGKGSKIWPYNEVRNKAMIPIATKPIIAHNIDLLIDLGVESITIAVNYFSNEIKRYFSKYKSVNCIDVENSNGPVDSLLQSLTNSNDKDSFIVLYGDTIVSKDDLELLLQSNENSVLLSKLKESTSNVIGANIRNGYINEIIGHPRENIDYQFAGFHLSSSSINYLKNSKDFMDQIQVGMMPVRERFIESALSDMLFDGNKIAGIIAKEPFFDIDKPWQILEANEAIVKSRCSQLQENIIGEESSIHELANIDGYVKLGKRCTIGRNVTIKGSLIVGDDTIIENGAIIDGDAVIDSNVYIGNYCFIADGSSVGKESYLGHGSEFWGLIINRVYLYHYMEMYGIIGDNCDIGAGSVCGTLRFDDSCSSHKVKGRKEVPYCNADAIYLGDYSRTGVNAMIMPGVKTGVYSLVGPGVILEKDLPSRKSVMVKQNLVYYDWGPEKYGW